MFVDVLGRVSNGQQITADAASTDTIDLGNVTPKRAIGTGEPLTFCCVITAIGTNTGSTKVQAIQSANANLSSPDIIGEVDLATADIVAGKIISVPLPAGYPTKRYVGMFHDITGTVDYTVTAWLAPRDMVSVLAQTYAKNYTV